MNKDKLEGLIISDCNLDILKGYLNNDTERPLVDVFSTPFGQVVPVLMGRGQPYWDKNYDFAVIWTQPQTVIGSFGKVLEYRQVPMSEIYEEVEEFSRLISGIKDMVKLIFVPEWVLPNYYRGFGILDLKDDTGIKNILTKMNLALAKSLSGMSSIYMLDTGRWIANSAANSFNPKMWYLTKTPFDIGVLKEAGQDIKAALSGSVGGAKKIIILDLDDTLWGGSVGELGWEKVILGGHDPEGEAFSDFQKELKSFINRGILLAIVSKNDEKTALDAIKLNPEMVLNIKDITGWRINWEDKAKNITDLLSQLNLGPQSAVFIDDNPVERARVKEALPEVLVPEWPEDKMLYKKALLSLRCFDAPALSKEDLERAKMYADEEKRQTLKGSTKSLDEWLATLEVIVRVEDLSEANIKRAAQLFNKTNQMNLSTRRLTEQELLDWTKSGSRRLWVFSVSDKFGNSGLTGIVSVEMCKKEFQIVDFLLSCRVMGRKVEEVMVHTAVNYAISTGAEKIWAHYISTPKNAPCLEFWKRSGFSYNEETNIFFWNGSEEYRLPNGIKVI